MANFSIDGRMKGLPDIQRTYMWELFIPDIGDVNQEDYVLRCRTAEIPGRSTEPIESFFMGTKQLFPGKTAFTNTLAVTIEEFEDMKVMDGLYSWQQQIFDYDPASDSAGQSQQPGKQDIRRDISLVMYKYNGDKLDNKIVFYNAWIQNVDAVALDYAAQDSVKYTATFQFDYWLKKPS